MAAKPINPDDLWLPEDLSRPRDARIPRVALRAGPKDSLDRWLSRTTKPPSHRAGYRRPSGEMSRPLAWWGSSRWHQAIAPARNAGAPACQRGWVDRHPDGEPTLLGVALKGALDSDHATSRPPRIAGAPAFLADPGYPVCRTGL